MTERYYKSGEIRLLQFRVQSQETASPVITAASWSLKKIDGTQTASGICEVDGNAVKALVPMSEEGAYRLEITVNVPPEIIKDTVSIRVTD